MAKKEITDWDKFRDQFVRETLRRASFRWPPRAMAIKAARTERLVNKSTGKLCWHVKCANCNLQILEREAHLDHIEPVVPTQSMQGLQQNSSGLRLGEYVLRMFPQSSGFAVLCFSCHRDKTSRESFERAGYKRRQREIGGEGRSGQVNVEPTPMEGNFWVGSGVDFRGKEVLLQRMEVCPKCQGTLYGSASTASTCFVCGGKLRP